MCSERNNWKHETECIGLIKEFVNVNKTNVFKMITESSYFETKYIPRKGIWIWNTP